MLLLSCFKQKARPWEASWRRWRCPSSSEGEVAPSPSPGLFLTLFPFPGFSAWGQEPLLTTPGPSLGALWVFQVDFPLFLQAHFTYSPT